jgi:hypothetical protein
MPELLHPRGRRHASSAIDSGCGRPDNQGNIPQLAIDPFVVFASLWLEPFQACEDAALSKFDYN